MIENSNLLPRQKNRLLSIEEGKARQILVDNTSQGVKFGIDLAQAYRDFCQARNDYLKAEEELEKFKSSNTQKVKKLDQNYAKLEYEMQEALVDKLAEFEKSKIKLNYLRKSINIDYHEGKIAKKAEEIQKSEINQTKIEYLVKWFLAQNRERPIPRENLSLAQEKYQVFAEIDQHVENMKEFLQPEIARLSKNVEVLNQIFGNFYASSDHNFGILNHLYFILKEMGYNPFSELDIAGFELESEIENSQTENNSLINSTNNNDNLLKTLSNKNLDLDWANLFKIWTKSEILKNNYPNKDIEILTNPCKSEQGLLKISQLLEELLAILPSEIKSAQRQKLTETEQEKLDNFLQKPSGIDFRVETYFIQIETLAPRSPQITDSNIPKILELLKKGNLFLGKDDSSSTIKKITNHLKSLSDQAQKNLETWQTKVDNLTQELIEVQEVYISWDIDQESLRIFGNLDDSSLNRTKEEIYPVKENLDILVTGCRQIFQGILPLELGKFRNRELGKMFDANYVSRLKGVHFRLGILKDSYESDKKYNSNFEHWLGGIKEDLSFLSEVINKRSNLNLNRIHKSNEIEKVQILIDNSLDLLDGLLQNTNQDNWSKTDVVKLAPINELLEKLTTEQTQKVREILESQKSWKTCELLLAVHSILPKNLN